MRRIIRMKMGHFLADINKNDHLSARYQTVVGGARLPRSFLPARGLAGAEGASHEENNENESKDHKSNEVRRE